MGENHDAINSNARPDPIAPVTRRQFVFSIPQSPFRKCRRLSASYSRIGTSTENCCIGLYRALGHDPLSTPSTVRLIHEPTTLPCFRLDMTVDFLLDTGTQTVRVHRVQLPTQLPTDFP